MSDPVEPMLEGPFEPPARAEARAGGLIWLSFCAAFLFFLVLVTGEVDRRYGALGLTLSGLLFLYESRRVRSSVAHWAGSFGSGCAGGFLMAMVVAKLLDVLGLVEIWDKRDVMTTPGLLILWSLVVVGMVVVARFHAASRKP